MLIAAGPDRFASIEACWSNEGFLYRHTGNANETPTSAEAWSEGATTDLASLVPDLDPLMPILMHPLAAWGLLEPVDALQADLTAPCRRDWLEFTEKASRTYTLATVLPPIADAEDEGEEDQDE